MQGFLKKRIYFIKKRMVKMNNGGKFSDGFLLGLIVGGVAVFLLGTEKGKKLLKVMTQEGGDALSNFLEELEEKPKTHSNGVSKKPLIVVESETLNFKSHDTNSEEAQGSTGKVQKSYRKRRKKARKEIF